MTVFMIIGISFAGLLILVLTGLLFNSRPLSSIQETIVIVFEALCAGFASAGFIGDATLDANGKLEGLDIGLTAGGGFAMAILVGYGMSRLLMIRGHAGVNGISFAWAKPTPYESIVRAILTQEQLVPQFKNFTSQQLTALIEPNSLQAKSLKMALEALGSLAGLESTVEVSAPYCTITILTGLTK